MDPESLRVEFQPSTVPAQKRGIRGKRGKFSTRAVYLIAVISGTATL
jgi:hypothetical protein